MGVNFHIVYIISTALIISIHSGCFDKSKFGTRCQLTCRCESTDQCNVNCTKCNDGYDKAPLCQRENVAWKRPVVVSPPHRDNNINQSLLATDEDPLTCVASSGGYGNYIEIDLQQSVFVTEISVNLSNYKCSGRCEVLVSPVRSSSYAAAENRALVCQDNLVLCHTDTIICRYPIVGQFLLFRLGDFHPWSICNLRVYQCAAYTFGVSCVNECECYNQSEICHPVFGTCVSGCASNSTNCRLGCNAGWYLQNGTCSGICRCRVATQCRSEDGVCVLGGCQSGWTGRDCQTLLAKAREKVLLHFFPPEVLSAIIFSVAVVFLGAYLGICWIRSSEKKKFLSSSLTSPSALGKDSECRIDIDDPSCWADVRPSDRSDHMWRTAESAWRENYFENARESKIRRNLENWEYLKKHRNRAVAILREQLDSSSHEDADKISNSIRNSRLNSSLQGRKSTVGARKYAVNSENDDDVGSESCPVRRGSVGSEINRKFSNKNERNIDIWRERRDIYPTWRDRRANVALDRESSGNIHRDNTK